LDRAQAARGEYLRPFCFGRNESLRSRHIGFHQHETLQVVGHRKKERKKEKKKHIYIIFVVFYIPRVQRFPIVGVHHFALSKARA